ncbi:MAG: SPOR domain-containing protein [Gammaproteobacteria bacterium]|nr:SPOR domain-containing protein [Gammaproteobacteria bacterium]
MGDSKKSSPWLWISLALIIGLFVAFILFLDHKIVKSSREQRPPEAEPTDISKPKFDFYTVLPKRQVDIPEPEQTQPPVPNQAADETAVLYLLQAGSFHKMQDADRRKAELAFLGLEAIINTAEVNGVTYHRVELGPFADGGAYSQVERQLIENDIQFIRKTVK